MTSKQIDTETVRSARHAHERPVTLQDIANKIGLSKCAVSQALRGRGTLSQATRDLVQATALELGYQASAHESARRLSLRKQGTPHVNHIIGLFMRTPTDAMDYFGHLYYGVLHGLMEEEFGLLTLQDATYHTAPDDSPLWSIFTRGDVDGVIFGHAVEPDLVARLHANPGFAGHPIVRLVSGEDAESIVRGDDYQGGYQAAQHLLAHGHRYFLHFMFPYQNPSEIHARMAGIRAALQEWRLPADTHLMAFPHMLRWNNPVTAPHTVDALSGAGPPDATDEEEFIAFLRRHPQITAIFGVNDANALHAWRALHHAGYRVPDDYSLVGFDDTDPLLSDTHQNLLASVRVPLAEIGRAAAHLVVQLVRAQATEPSIQVIPVAFIPRASVGPARG